MSEDSGRADKDNVVESGEMVQVKEEVKESDNGSIVALPTQEQPPVNVAKEVPQSHNDLSDVDAEGESEAETWIQSPEKKGNIVDNAPSLKPTHVATDDGRDRTTARTTPSSESKSRKRKRGEDFLDDNHSLGSSRHSSPLSSPRLDPRSSDNDSESDSSPRSQANADGDARVERTKAKNSGSDEDEAGESKPVQRKIRKRRPSDISHLPKLRQYRSGGPDPGAVERRETRSATYPRQSSEERSPSPPPTARREHKRGASTQLISGEFEKKRRGRPPLINTKRNRSADGTRNTLSDGSSSPPRNRNVLNKISSLDHDTMSPAKATGPRKWRDKNGRTFLSRACNNDDLEGARARFAERPDDLNLPDNAGNTPLQIAALEGFADIVKFLLEKGCEVDTRNIDKETPLIDAVENGHLAVVRLLLEFGANPRLGNAKGDEPYELVPPDDENYEIIRKLLADAKEKDFHRRKSQDHTEVIREGTTSRAASAASPRDSPPIPTPRSPPTFASSRRRTGRSESTRNDLLWQANTQENLTRLAAKGDVQGVCSILNILQKAETDALIAAAKAGHEEVLQYLLGMGDPDPDPEPVSHQKSGFNTPMLAAIGRGHPDVVKLLVDQSGFDPTRRLYRHRAYFEISAERKGENWQKEHDILKAAYDNYSTNKSRKHGSPRKTRDIEKHHKPRPIPRSVSPASSDLRHSSSPNVTHRSVKSPESEKKQKRSEATGDTERRRAHVKNDASEVAVSSDHDLTTKPKPANRPRRSQSDLPAPPKMDEITHRRRRLVTGKEHRRRRSAVSDDSGSDELTDVVEVKRDPKPSTGSKRPRSSPGPDDHPSKDGDAARSTAKKRRTILESSPEEPRPTSNTQILSTMRAPELRKDSNSSEVKPAKESSGSPRLRRRSLIEHKEAEIAAPKAKQESEQPVKSEPGTTAVTKNVEKQEGDQAPEGPEPEQMQLDDDDDQSAKEAQKAKEESEKKAAEESAAKAKAELQRKEEDERRVAEEARAAEAAAAAKRKEAEDAEAEAKRKAEEEAVKVALAKRKEEEERQERARREVEERKRRHQEEQHRQQQIETERKRRESLPMILSKSAVMLDEGSAIAKSREWLSRFLPLFTARTRQLDPSCTPDIQDEEWVPNFQIAALLATKDLRLQNYTSFEKRPVSALERDCLWKVSRNILSYEYEANAFNTSIKQAVQREESEKPKFMAMEELFWVKFSDFQEQIFRHPHLSALNLKKQPISLRTPFFLTKSVSGSPRSNGVMSPNPNLTMSASSVSPPKGVNGTSLSPVSSTGGNNPTTLVNGNVSVR